MGKRQFFVAVNVPLQSREIQVATVQEGEETFLTIKMEEVIIFQIYKLDTTSILPKKLFNIMLNSAEGEMAICLVIAFCFLCRKSNGILKDPTVNYRSENF